MRLQEALFRPTAYVVDDEVLAVSWLTRKLDETGRVQIVGKNTNPELAVQEITATNPDVLFLDIQMPVMNGFELLARLPVEPLVIFTTAFDRYALEAFDVNSIDYLLKPIQAEQLERALNKLSRLHADGRPPEWHNAVEDLTLTWAPTHGQFARRLASKINGRIRLLEVKDISYFVAEDKLTFAVCEGRKHIVDKSIAAIERLVDPNDFVRIHRSTLVNINRIYEIRRCFGGRSRLRLTDMGHTELAIARDRLRGLKDRLASD